MHHAFPGVLSLLSHWRPDPFWIIVLLIAGWWYVHNARKLEAANPRVVHPRWKMWTFLGGLVLIAICTMSPLQHYGNVFLMMNFLGMLILLYIAAPLLVMSSPLTLAFRTEDYSGRVRLRRIWRSRTMSILMYPLLTWFVFAIGTYVWQFTRLTDLGAHHAWVRDLELLSMVVVGIMYWMPALCMDPVRWRMTHLLRVFYIFVEVTHKALFGGMFLSMTHEFHPSFAAALPGWGPGAMMDQRIGILFVTILGNMIFLVAIAYTVWKWESYETRHVKSLDARLERERLKAARHEAAMESIFRRGV